MCGLDILMFTVLLCKNTWLDISNTEIPKHFFSTVIFPSSFNVKNGTLKYKKNS